MVPKFSLYLDQKKVINEIIFCLKNVFEKKMC